MIELTPTPQYQRKVRLFLDGQEVTDNAFWARVPAEPGVEAEGEIKCHVRPFVRQDDGLKSEHKTGRVYWVWKAN